MYYLTPSPEFGPSLFHGPFPPAPGPAAVSLRVNFICALQQTFHRHHYRPTHLHLPWTFIKHNKFSFITPRPQIGLLSAKYGSHRGFWLWGIVSGLAKSPEEVQNMDNHQHAFSTHLLLIPVPCSLPPSPMYIVCPDGLTTTAAMPENTERVIKHDERQLFTLHPSGMAWMLLLLQPTPLWTTLWRGGDEWQSLTLLGGICVYTTGRLPLSAFPMGTWFRFRLKVPEHDKVY